MALNTTAWIQVPMDFRGTESIFSPRSDIAEALEEAGVAPVATPQGRGSRAQLLRMANLTRVARMSRGEQTQLQRLYASDLTRPPLHHAFLPNHIINRGWDKADAGALESDATGQGVKHKA
ncbi:hypothetical protein E4U54_002500 [Claviceps lovelessii]|nr:hypothetical protein E4U54_002500 [Claviceps lovelessii]